MTPGVFRVVPDQRKLEEQIERQMGCMTGFLQLFDRQQILAGKNLCPTKRLPSSSTAGSSSPSERSEVSTVSLVKEVPLLSSPSSPEQSPSSPENVSRSKCHPRRHTLPLPVFEVKDGLKTSWKLREAPRLSLDSRASVDAKGKLRPREIQTTPELFSGHLSDASDNGENQEKRRRSPSVVARLMGLEVLPDNCSCEPPKRAELRRSSSESRVHRDMSQFSFQDPSPMPSVFGPWHGCSEMRSLDAKPEAPRPPHVSFQRKSFHSQEFFPEPKQVGTLYSEIERRLRMRGIEEPAKDLETLKQILEALQLKGLLHSKPLDPQNGNRLNIAYDRRPRPSTAGQSPIVVMKPVPKPSARIAGSHHANPLPRSISPHQPEVLESIPSTRSLRGQNARRQSLRPPELSLGSRSPGGSPVRRRPPNADGQRSPAPQRRIPAVNPPKSSPKKPSFSPVGPPKSRRPTVDISSNDKIYPLAEDDETYALLTGTTVTSPASQFEIERTRTEEYRAGRSLLERCDKLLHSIAAITSSSAEQVTPTDRQPSPVSVLDSTFLSDESLPSPLPKRTINFNDQLTDWDEDHWNNPPSSTYGSNSSSGPQALETSADKGEDYAYVADVVCVSELNRSDAFATIEKRHHSSTSTPLHRRLIFDAVTELVERRRHLPPWDVFCHGVAAGSGSSLAQDVWEELHQIQEHVVADDVMEVTCAVIRKDIAAAVSGVQGWAVSGEEMSHAVLHIERQVFKDLVADTIHELADLAGRSRRTTALSRRKLLF